MLFSFARFDTVVVVSGAGVFCYLANVRFLLWLLFFFWFCRLEICQDRCDSMRARFVLYAAAILGVSTAIVAINLK